MPEDVLAEDVKWLPSGKRVLERKDLEILKKKEVKSVKIMHDLPRFGPFLFFALLLLLWLEANPLNIYYIFSVGLVHLDFSI